MAADSNCSSRQAELPGRSPHELTADTGLGRVGSGGSRRADAHQVTASLAWCAAAGHPRSAVPQLLYPRQRLRCGTPQICRCEYRGRRGSANSTPAIAGDGSRTCLARIGGCMDCRGHCRALERGLADRQLMEMVVGSAACRVPGLQRRAPLRGSLGCVDERPSRSAVAACCSAAACTAPSVSARAARKARALVDRARGGADAKAGLQAFSAIAACARRTSGPQSG